jgi:hypothetical protein
MKKWQAIVASVACSSMLFASAPQIQAKDIIVPYELKHTTTTSQVMFHTDERFNDLNYNVIDGLMYKTYETVPVKAKTLYGIYNDKYQFKIKNGQLYYLVDGLYKKRFTGTFTVDEDMESDDTDHKLYTYTFKLGKLVNFESSTYIYRFSKDATFTVKHKKTTKTATGNYVKLIPFSDYSGAWQLAYSLKNGYLYYNNQKLNNAFITQKKAKPVVYPNYKTEVLYKVKAGRIYRGVFKKDENLSDEAKEQRYKLYSGKLSVQHKIAQNYEHSVLKVKNGKVIEVTNTEYVVK